MVLVSPFYDAPGIFFSEFKSPATNGLITGINSAFSQQFPEISMTRGKPKVEPNGLSDHILRQPMAVIGYCFHENLIASCTGKVNGSNPLGSLIRFVLLPGQRHDMIKPIQPLSLAFLNTSADNVCLLLKIFIKNRGDSPSGGQAFPGEAICLILPGHKTV